MPRLRISKQLEKSAAAHSIVKTDASNEQEYLAPGAAGQILTIVAGVPAWSAPAVQSFTLTDGTNAEVIANGDTLTIAAGNGMSAVVSATDLLTVAARLSTDAGNDISFGSDGGLYLSKDNLVTGASWNDATNELVLTFDNGSTVPIPIVDAIATFLADFTISDGTATDVVYNHETLLFEGIGVTPTVSANKVSYRVAQLKEVFAPANGDTTVTLANAAHATLPIMVMRNGVELLASEFSVAGAVITFADSFSVSGGAIYSESVIVHYYKA